MRPSTSTTAVPLVLALAFPVWAFALGPVVLGVPHLLADSSQSSPALAGRVDHALVGRIRSANRVPDDACAVA